ncbi:MAG: transporter [Steroidobacter sp.]
MAAAACALLMLAGPAIAENEGASTAVNRQSLDDAWWTGPILAASAGTLPQGHFLVEPYVYDAISYGRYDADGERSDTKDTNSFGSQTYLLYGLTDRVSIGLIPRFAFNDVSGGKDSSGVRFGDLTLQAQYRLTQFREGSWIPTTSLVLQETLPTGKHDRLGSRLSDGAGSGAYSTTIALYSQYYFWLPNGRILRTRLNASHTFADGARIEDVSVYGTDAGFRGRAQPGNSFTLNAAAEYSLTRNWVLALDVLYQRDANTRVSGYNLESVNGEPQRIGVLENFGSSRRIGLAPAVEYNWTSRVGVIVGARWFPAGRNAEASITPVAAINLVY